MLNKKGNKMSQKERILKHLQNGYPITPLDALNKFGCFRLSAVIFDLRHEGYYIVTRNVTNINNKIYAEYKLVNSPIGQVEF